MPLPQKTPAEELLARTLKDYERLHERYFEGYNTLGTMLVVGILLAIVTPVLLGLLWLTSSKGFHSDGWLHLWILIVIGGLACVVQYVKHWYVKRDLIRAKCTLEGIGYRIGCDTSKDCVAWKESDRLVLITGTPTSNVYLLPPWELDFSFYRQVFTARYDIMEPEDVKRVTTPPQPKL